MVNLSIYIIYDIAKEKICTFMLVAIQNESIMFTIDGNNIEIKKEVRKINKSHN